MKVFLACLLTFLFVVFVWAFLSWAASSSFDQTVSSDNVRDLLASQGLEVCNEKELSLDQVPGFTEGKVLWLSEDCSMGNLMTVSVVGFSSQTARNGAMQRIQSIHRNGFGPNLAYVYGPYVILVQGPRTTHEQTRLGQILHSVGATP